MNVNLQPLLSSSHHLKLEPDRSPIGDSSKDSKLTSKMKYKMLSNFHIKRVHIICRTKFINQL